MKSQNNVIRSKAADISVLGLTFLFGCLGVSGASYQYELSVSDLDFSVPRFQFAKPLLAPPKGQRNSIELNRFLVVTRSSQGWDYKNPVWAFQLEPGSYAVVDRIAYGAVPSGFKETTAAKPLLVGASYLAVAFAAGGGAEKEFMMDKSTK